RHSATTGESTKAGSSSLLKSERPNSSTSPAARAVLAASPFTGVGGTRSFRYTSAVASPSAGFTSTRPSGRPAGIGLTTSPRPVHQAAGPFRKNGTSLPSSAPILANSAREAASLHSSLSPTSVAAASLEPPPRPAPQGIRFVR